MIFYKASCCTPYRILFYFVVVGEGKEGEGRTVGVSGGGRGGGGGRMGEDCLRISQCMTCKHKLKYINGITE